MVSQRNSEATDIRDARPRARRKGARLLFALIWAGSEFGVASWGDPVFAQPLQDLAFKGVITADYKTETNTDLLGKHIGPDDALLKITFTSRTDLGKVAFEQEMLLSDDVKFCDQPGKSVLGSWVDIFHDEFSLNAVRADRGVRAAYMTDIAKQPTDAPITYHIYIRVRQGPRSILVDGGTANIDPYDLASAPRDVCFRILGRSLLGGGFASNVVVVPSDALRLAIEHR